MRREKQIGQLRKELADLPFCCKIELMRNNLNKQEKYNRSIENNQLVIMRICFTSMFSFWRNRAKQTTRASLLTAPNWKAELADTLSPGAERQRRIWKRQRKGYWNKQAAKVRKNWKRWFLKKEKELPSFTEKASKNRCAERMGIFKQSVFFCHIPTNAIFKQRFV